MKPAALSQLPAALHRSRASKHAGGRTWFCSDSVKAGPPSSSSASCSSLGDTARHLVGGWVGGGSALETGRAADHQARAPKFTTCMLTEC